MEEILDAISITLEAFEEHGDIITDERLQIFLALARTSLEMLQMELGQAMH